MVTITFDRPEYLWFLFAVPFVVVTHFYLLRHTKRKAMKFANFVVIKRITGERLITKNYTLLAVRILVILCAILAVAGTSVWYDTRTNQNEYVIALDTSASMTAQDIPPTRLEAAKLYAGQFIDELDANTRVGLVSFSGLTFIEQPLTLNRKDLKDSLALIDVASSGTDIPGAVITSVNALTLSDRGRALILISDGSNTVEDFRSRSLLRAVTYAKVHQTKIYTIGVGKELQTPVGYLPTYYNVSATYDADNLAYLANETGGQYYHAADPESLQQAYKDIKSADKTSRLRMDLTGGLTLACLALIMLEWGLISSRFRMIP